MCLGMADGIGEGREKRGWDGLAVDIPHLTIFSFGLTYIHGNQLRLSVDACCGVSDCVCVEVAARPEAALRGDVRPPPTSPDGVNMRGFSWEPCAPAANHVIGTCSVPCFDPRTKNVGAWD